MQHLTFADKNLLVGEGIAHALVQYASHLGRLGSADHVEVRGIGIDGEEVVMHLVLNSGTVLATETTTSTLPEPDNADTVAYITAQLAQFELPGGTGAGPPTAIGGASPSRPRS